MIPRFSPDFEMKDLLSVVKPSSPDTISIFEQKYAQNVGQKYSISFSYGRIALYSYLKAMGISQQEIVCTAYTCVVMAHAIHESGNECIFVDINLNDLNMDFEQLKKSINHKTAAIVFTSLYGNPVNISQVEFVRLNYPHIKIIQDCTHVIDGTFNNEKIVHYGDISLFGLGLSKPITSIFGGMLTTNNWEIFNQVSEFKKTHFCSNVLRGVYMKIYFLLAFVAFKRYFYGITNRLERLGLLNYFVKMTDDNKINLPKDSFETLSSFEALIGLNQIKKYKKIKNQNKKIFNIYNENIIEMDFCKKIEIHPEANISHFNLLISNRKNLISHLLDNNIQVGEMYNYSIPETKNYNRFTFVSNENNAGFVSKNIVNLPLCVKREEAKKISKLINEFMLIHGKKCNE